ncbi:hypothetical protein ABGB17_04400 [Sphaerisporangium sp. B11E5]|uniref:hypothetical protein n=1 Tax=Sphaerisporangium sp. B11E5 TaxID=3153563 RepID=UPI00325CB2F4
MTPDEGRAMNTTAPMPAWPFLVARGRYRGYRVVLAPDVLLDGQEYGVLDDTVVPSKQEDHPSVIHVTTRSGRPLTVVHATHVVTAADLAPPGTSPSSRAPRDQHSRPLQLLYGYVCTGRVTPELRDEDLTHARESSLDTYRRFLADEETFSPEPAPAFPVPSRTPAPRSDPPGGHPAPLPTRPGDHSGPAPEYGDRLGRVYGDRQGRGYGDRQGRGYGDRPGAVPAGPGGHPDWDPGGWEFTGGSSLAGAPADRREIPTRRHVLALYAIAAVLGTLALALYLFVWSRPAPPECPEPLPDTTVQRFSPTPPTSLEQETAPPDPKAQGSGATSADCATKDKKDKPQQ